ncbi:MAG: germination protein YpeB [Eubacteriales bacterium]
MKKNMIIGILTVVLLGMVFLAYNKNEQNVAYRTQIENSHQYNFQSLIDAVKNINTTLSKATISSSKEMTTQLFSDVWRYADSGQSSLSRLPIKHTAFTKAQTFLNQLSDFAYTMAKMNLNGESMTKEQQQDLERLNNSSTYLLQQLQIVEEQMQEGEISFNDIQKDMGKELEETDLVTKGFETIDKEMVAYPKLIYDGPFSDHIEDLEPKGIQGEEISEKEGQNKVKEFVGEKNIESIKSNGSSEGVIKTFVYDVDIKDQEENAYVEITKIGGHVLKVMKNRVPEEQKIEMTEAQKKADEFLKEKGYENLVNTYYEKYANVGVFNYAYVQNDIIIYPDLIKVQISLDNGEFLGIEAQGYHFSHCERKIEKPNISIEEAKKKVNGKLEITKERLAIIPTESKNEVLCYEFKGTYKDDWYIIYINASTGREQQILKIIEADESVLTL